MSKILVYAKYDEIILSYGFVSQYLMFKLYFPFSGYKWNDFAIFTLQLNRKQFL